jgi:hypothetical protein
LRGCLARRTRFGAVPPEIAFRRHLILPRDDECLPGRGQSSPKASRDTGIPTRTARADARGCIMMVIGVEGQRRADTCGVAWRPPLRARGLTIFRRYFPVQTAADGLAAGGMHASRVCRGRVFGTTARLVCRPRAHLATSAAWSLQLKSESAATFAARDRRLEGWGLTAPAAPRPPPSRS